MIFSSYPSIQEEKLLLGQGFECILESFIQQVFIVYLKKPIINVFLQPN